ncbi:hypothetical protein [Phenylobacterium sp.]|jgi:hypothetical protein|uniref:hypothetical protein n=1 Tax=Phenylobacterium sp. TaxID=1871053 RepID=UPI002E3081FD|nr:hypothetical protein [Phenylobacterium sp.]HEX4709491.1 hypothetical protein [Phenylobacterium sp.]
MDVPIIAVWLASNCSDPVASRKAAQMRHLSLTAASIALFLLAAPVFAEGDNGNHKDNGNHYGAYGNNGNHYGNDANKDRDDDKGNNDNDGKNSNHNGKGGGNLTTPSPEAAVGLPALAAGVGALLYLRSRRRKAA